MAEPRLLRYSSEAVCHALDVMRQSFRYSSGNFDERARCSPVCRTALKVSADVRLLCYSYTAVHSPVVHVPPIKTLQTNSNSGCVKATVLAHLVFPRPPPSQSSPAHPSFLCPQQHNI